MPQNDQDRRRANRVAFSMHAPVSTGPGNSDLIKDSSTIDISELGVRLRLRGQIVPGQSGNFFLNPPPGKWGGGGTAPAGFNNKLIGGLKFPRPFPALGRR